MPEEDQEFENCPECGEHLLGDDSFCTECGWPHFHEGSKLPAALQGFGMEKKHEG